MSQLALDIELDRSDFRLAIKESLDLAGITAVFGANGSGKTSLLRVIAGLESSTKGTLLFRDEEWQGQSGILQPEARAIGYVFQDGRLFSHLDVRGNLEFPARHGRRVGPIEFDATVRSFELEHLLTRYPDALSGGERQRVAIARALLANPSLLLMDEPLSSLDHARKRELLPLIKKLPAHYKIPIIYVTHDIDELVYLADSVILLANGQNIAHGSTREILERSDFEQIAGLRDSGNVLEAEISSHIKGATIIALPTGELRIPEVDGSPGETVRLRINPRDVVLATEKLSGISIRNSLPATIRAIDHQQDGQSLISLTVGAQRLSARVTSDAVRDLDLHEGRQVYALIKTVALDVFATR